MSTFSPTISRNKENFPPNSPLSEMGTSVPCLESSGSVFVKERLNLSCSLKRKRPPKIQIPDVLKEIKGGSGIDTQSKFSGLSPVKDDVVSRFEDGCVGLFSVKGKKKFMEDTYKVVSCIDGNPNKGFFGVYDGHGGRKAAEFVAETLHKNIIEMVDNCEGKMSKEEAVKTAYLRTEGILGTGSYKDVGSGACCATVLIEGTEMVVSNLGDCRAVVCRGGEAEALTKDHRAERKDEQKRIEDKGGYVEFHKGAWRVHGILSVSGSIGDAHLKEWVVSDPDTRILDLTPDMDFLVLASDGLWDEVGCHEAVNIVLQSTQIETKVNLPLGELDSKNQRSLEENNNEYACVSTNSSPKVKRVSFIKQRQPSPRSSSFRKKTTADILREGILEFDTENESPPAKLRRTVLFPHKNMAGHSPNQENNKPSSEGLVAACKKLTNLAVTRGSMDDITVMIIDLKHFMQAIPRITLPIAS